MIQGTINQRLKILIEKVSPNSKVFSETIEESPATTHNYIGKRQTEPRAQYLSKVLSHFADLNARWLMTGEGEPFLPTPTENTQLTANAQKFFRSPIIGSNQGTANQQQNTSGKDERLQTELSLARQELEHLRQQLAAKDTIIQSKQEVIDLLKATQPKP